MKFTKIISGYYRYKNWEITKLHGAWKITKGALFASECTWVSTLTEAKKYIQTMEAK